MSTMFIYQRISLRRIVSLFIVNSLVLPPSHQLLHKGLGSVDEDRLIEHLFDRQGYNPLIRPVRNLTDTVRVKFGMAMIQLINVDEKNQVMKSNVWLRMLWHDYQLQWTPTDFGDINVIRMPAETVWKPDIVLFNNADGKYEVSYKPNVVIHDNGEVLWIPPAIYKSSCPIDVQYFPFDEQQCEMKFGSWTFNADQVSLSWYEGQEKVDISDYVNSGTWDITACPGTYNMFQHDDTDPGQNRASQITFTLRIRRKTLFYTVNLIIPCVLISLISVAVFYLPADAGEKMTMCISILLALIVFLLLVSKILPPTSNNIPLIAKYLLFTFIVNIFTILITVIIINWNFRTPRTHSTPPWVRTVFLRYLPKLLGIVRPSYDDRWAKKAYNQKLRRHARADISRSSVVSAVRSSLSQVNDVLSAQDKAQDKQQYEQSTTFDTNRTTSGGDSGDQLTADDFNPSAPTDPEHRTFQLTPKRKKAIEAVRFIAAHLKNEDDYSEVLEDWRYISLVIDRLQLYIFLTVTIVGTAAILIGAPHIFESIDQDEYKERILISTDGIG